LELAAVRPLTGFNTGERFSRLDVVLQEKDLSMGRAIEPHSPLEAPWDTVFLERDSIEMSDLLPRDLQLRSGSDHGRMDFDSLRVLRIDIKSDGRNLVVTVHFSKPVVREWLQPASLEIRQAEGVVRSADEVESDASGRVIRWKLLGTAAETIEWLLLRAESILDADGDTLDGDGDGVSGGDFEREWRKQL